MSIDSNEEKAPRLLELPAILDLSAARTLKELLQNALPGEGDLVVDASSVQRLTTPCLQVLVSAARLSETGGPALRLRNVPAAFAEMVSMLGLSPALRIEGNCDV